MVVWLPALLAALVGGALALVGLGRALPGTLGTESLLPHAGALAAAVVLGLVVAARREPRLQVPARAAAVSCGVGALLLAVGLVLGGPGIVGGDAREVGRGACAGIGLAVWLGAFVLERRQRRRLALATPILVGVTMAALAFESAGFLHGALAGRWEQGWNVYHYYMGSKYFPELGYGELYSAHLAADDENGRRDYGFVREARSMATYRETKRDPLVARFDRHAVFSDERWEEFTRDVHAFRPLLPEDKWKGVLIDLGYHPSPAWTVVGTPLANLAEVRGRGWWWIVNSDLLFHLVSLVAMLWAFGPRTTAVAVLWVATAPLNSGNFAGGFLRHDWLHSCILAAAFWHRGKPGAAGVALSWGAMTRIFPGLIAVPILVRAGVALARGEKLAPAHRAFLLALTLACAALLGASHLTGRGLRAWPEWISIIAKHGHLHPATSNRRVGVGRLVLHSPSSRDLFGTVKGRGLEGRIARTLWKRRAIQAVGLVLLVAAVWRRRDLDAMVLMTFAVFLLTTLSRYHGSMWILLFFLRPPGPHEPVPWPAALAGGVLLLGVAAFFAIPGMTAQYYVLNYEMLAMFTALCVAFLLEDRRQLRGAERGEGVQEGG